MSKTFNPTAKKVTFSDAKVGDRVWSFNEGWGTIKNRYSPNTTYPLKVEFESGVYRTYTLWGLIFFTDQNPTLFWDEVKFETPEKPMPALKVDAKVFVWGHNGMKYKRHLSHIGEDGNLYAFNNGQTSFTGEGDPETGVTSWPNWELAE